MMVDVGAQSAVPEGATKCAIINGRKLALSKVDGTVYCLDNTCTHDGGPLCEGRLDRFIVACPWHRSRFDVRSGQVADHPRAGSPNPIRSHSKMIESGSIFHEGNPVLGG